MESKGKEKVKGGEDGKDCDWNALVVFILCHSLRDVMCPARGDKNDGKRKEDHAMAGAPTRKSVPSPLHAYAVLTLHKTRPIQTNR